MSLLKTFHYLYDWRFIMYYVTGYDKDNDIYDTLFITDNLAIAKEVGYSYQALCNEDRILSTSKDREPYDWIELFTKDGELVMQFCK